jgi:hypothetical protein
MLDPLIYATKKEDYLAREWPKARAARRYLSQCFIAGVIVDERPNPRKVADDMGAGSFVASASACRSPPAPGR